LYFFSGNFFLLALISNFSALANHSNHSNHTYQEE